MFFVTFLRDGIAGADRELIEGTGRASLRDAGRFKPEFRGLKPTATIRLSLRDLEDGSERQQRVLMKQIIIRCRYATWRTVANGDVQTELAAVRRWTG